MVYAPPSSLCDPKRVQRVGFAKLDRNLVQLPASSTKRGRGVVLEAPGLDQEEIKLFGHEPASKNQHELVRSHSTCIWCWDKPRANLDSQDTPRPGLGRCHHHTPYNIRYVRPREWHPNGSFSRDFQSGIPKLSRVEVSGLWDFIAPRPDL